MRVVVSLAAISDRVRNLPAVIRSILTQSLPPERIYLWLSESPYLLDKGITQEELPDELIQMAEDSNGCLQICYTDNIGPHRKLLPMLRMLKEMLEFPLVVTADDDTIYPKRWLQALVEGHVRYQTATAFRARRIIFKGRYPQPYNDWEKLTPFSEEVGLRLVATGNLGFLVDPRMLDSRILDDNLLSISPSRSDIWIAAALMAKGTRLAKLSLSRVFPDEDGLELTQDQFPRLEGKYRRQKEDAPSELFRFNEKRNDKIIRQTFDFFDVLPKILS